MLKFLKAEMDLDLIFVFELISKKIEVCLESCHRLLSIRFRLLSLHSVVEFYLIVLMKLLYATAAFKEHELLI